MHHLRSVAGCANHPARTSFRSFALAVLLWAACGTALIGPARAEYMVAPDVVVFCEPALRHALGDLGALWRNETGIPVRIFTSPTPAPVEQVAHGARSDVLIGEGDAPAAAAGERHPIASPPPAR
jgi:ABC-type molybdate transport system substrate-binding protein